MRIIGVIPSRYKSTRFPGKPLALINDKPMVYWVYQQCLKVKELDGIYIATDDVRIADVCREYNLNYIMTSENNLTGTDRVAEVASKIDADIFVNIQGDEPMIEPDVISTVIKPLLDDENLLISNLMTRITDPVDIANPTICKAVTNKDGFGIYLTRAASPYPKGRIDYCYEKALGIFAMRPKALDFFREYGKKIGKAKIESIEDIEMLRFIENGFKIKFTEVQSKSIAVDTLNDLIKVRSIMEKKIN